MSMLLDTNAQLNNINVADYPNFEVFKNWSVPLLVYYLERNRAKGAVIAAWLCEKALELK